MPRFKADMARTLHVSEVTNRKWLETEGDVTTQVAVTSVEVATKLRKSARFWRDFFKIVESDKQSNRDVAWTFLRSLDTRFNGVNSSDFALISSFVFQTPTPNLGD